MTRFARITGRTLSLATVVKRLPPGFTAFLNVTCQTGTRAVFIAGEGDLDAFLLDFVADTAGVFRAEEMSEASMRHVFELYDEVWPS